MNRVDIGNRALILIGEEPVQSFDDPQTEARRLKNFFDSAKKTILTLHNWHFAKKRVALTQTTAPAFGFTNAYTLPPDRLRILEVNDGDTTYRIEGDLLLTNERTVELIYLWDIDDSVVTAPLFDEALAHYLAYYLSRSLTESSSVRDEMWAAYNEIIRKARFVDATEETPPEIDDEYFLEAREHQGFVRDPQT